MEKDIVFKLKFKNFIKKIIRKNYYKFKSNNLKYLKNFVIKDIFD